MKAILTVLVLSFAAWSGCRTPSASVETLSRYEFSSPHMGTLWHVTLYAPDLVSASNAVRSAFARVRALDQCLTDYDAESELERLKKSPAGVPVKVSDDLFRCLKAAVDMARETDGAFDPTVGLEVQLWRRARRQRVWPDEQRLAAARQTVGWQQLRFDARNQTITLLSTNLWLDVGGIAKGFGADEALKVLRRAGFSRALVAASGDLAIGDPPPGKPGWRVGVGSVGGSTNELAQMLMLRNVGVSTSGDAEQFVEFNGTRYAHIVDPRTGIGLTNQLQVTMIAPCATRSDALATAICVMGSSKGFDFVERHERLAACILQPKPGGGMVLFKSKRFLRMEKEMKDGRSISI